ncbi:glutamate--cysteine ligase regulatory subunit-like [Halichondria panicea]|uniref:glutamate--cysteine ligase regulatory subunit-like n=1 Tax=Halichondria panicea TaxID=6063 RepID=UPI00312B4DB6
MQHTRSARRRLTRSQFQAQEKMSATTERGVELLGSSARVIMHSGNIASWSKLRKRGVLTSTAELVSATEASFTSWLGRQGDETEPDSRVVVRNAGLCAEISDNERDSCVFTLKVFLLQWGAGHDVEDAIRTTLSELGLTSVSTLILAFPPCPSTEFTLDRVKSLWEGAESLVASGVATDLGTADLDKKQFEELYEWASVKPKVNQVNLAHCCTMPEDLVAFSKVHDVRLMTHNDDKVILPQAQLQAALDTTLGGRVDHTHWTPSWVIKYTSIIRLRGIISHKGYLVNLNTK